jgi:hypothetical protein
VVAARHGGPRCATAFATASGRADFIRVFRQALFGYTSGQRLLSNLRPAYRHLRYLRGGGDDATIGHLAEGGRFMKSKTILLAPGLVKRAAMRRLCCAGALLVIVSVFGSAGFAETGCRTTTLSEANRQNWQDLFFGGVGLAKQGYDFTDGIVLLAKREGELVPFIISAALLAKELAEFSKSVSTRRQLQTFNGFGPGAMLQACPASGTLASELGFERLTLLRPLSPSLRVGGIGQQPLTQEENNASLGTFQAKLQQLILTAPRTTLPPQSQTTTPHTMPAPAQTLPSWWSRPPAAIAGRVADATSGYPISSAFVTLINTNDPRGASPRTFTLDDGSFEFDYLPAGAYVLSVTEPGYSGAATLVTAPGRASIWLQRAAVYPCNFTVVNGTGWRLVVSAGANARTVLIPPWQSFTDTLAQPAFFFAAAYFTSGPPLTWGPIAGRCDGPGYIRLVYSPQ